MDAPVVTEDPIEIEVEIPRSQIVILMAGDEGILVLEKPGCKLTLKRIED